MATGWGGEDHPLIEWYAALKRADAASMQGGDIVLGDLGGKRFALGVAEGPIPVLAHLPEDASAVGSIKWTSAAIFRNYKGRDWVALSCRDARVRGSGEMNPVPLRLWIPVAVGRLDAWASVNPTVLRLQQMDGAGAKPRTSGPAAGDLALKVMS